MSSTMRSRMLRFSTALVPCLIAASPTLAQKPKLVPLATFGCDDCDTPFLFSFLESITVTSRGDVIVVDRSDPRVRVFDARGTLIRSLGRTGKGPAEISTARAVSLSATGDYEVTDQDLGRVTRMNAAARETGLLTIGGFITSASVTPGGRGVALATTRPMEQSLKIRIVSDMKVKPFVEITRSDFPATGDILTVPFARAADGRLAVGDGDGEYAIIVYGPDARKKMDIRRNVARVKKTAEEIEQEEQLHAKMMAQIGQMAAAAGAKQKNGAQGSAPKPKPARPQPVAKSAAKGLSTKAASNDSEHFRPYFGRTALQFDDAGRLWVQVDRGAAGETVFDVFDANGRFLNEVRVDATIREYAFGNSVMAAITLTEDGIEKVRTWKVAAQ